MVRVTIDLTEQEIEALERIIVAEDIGDGIKKTDAEHRRHVVEKILMETGDFLTVYYGDEQKP